LPDIHHDGHWKSECRPKGSAAELDPHNALVGEELANHAVGMHANAGDLERMARGPAVELFRDVRHVERQCLPLGIVLTECADLVVGLESVCANSQREVLAT
jgi:hypothetical protein